MRNASLDDITKFLEYKRVAFVGVSRDSQHFSRSLFREFLINGYEPVPVNPLAGEIEGLKCFAHVSDITPRVGAALLMTGSPETTDQALGECHNADIRNIWVYKNVCTIGEHEHLVESCRTHGATVVEGFCPYMFLPNPALVHRVHRFLMKVTGHYPL